MAICNRTWKVTSNRVPAAGIVTERR